MNDGWFWAAGRIVGNTHEWTTVYASDCKLYPTREAAISAGFKRAEASDDFNVGRVVSGELVWFGWMDEQHPVDEYVEVAADLRSSGVMPVGGSDTPADQPEPELQERVEYGHQTVELGWVPECRGIKYASHQRTVYWRADPPLLIDHWSDPQPAPADQPECAEHAEERAAVKAWCGLDGGNGKGYGTSLGHVESAREYDARHEAHHNARPVLADQGEKRK